jgi:hypothetical protein
MKQYIVWHAKEPTFGFGEQPVFPEAYKRVAIVNSKGPDEVFRVTNHIDSDWTKNPEVALLMVKQARSTSVGDVVEELRPDGKKFLCDMVGWKEIA